MKRLSAIILVLITNYLLAQPTNLILNPGFEDFKPGKAAPNCAYGTGQLAFTNATKDWTTFPDSTPDLIVWNDSCHFPQPHAGGRAVGLITYLPGIDWGRGMDFHEFIQGKFSKPLTKGKEYTFAFYIQLGKAAGERHIRHLNKGNHNEQVIPLAAGSLGVWFTDYEEKLMTLDVAFPQLVWYDPIETKPGEWLLLSKTFKAERPFTHFTIGNFTTDNNTATNLPNTAEIDEFNAQHPKWQEKKRRVGYYLLDDFWLGEGPPPAPTLSIVEDLKKNNAYTFKNVNFESGKSDLLPSSIPELDALVSYLMANKNTKVEIGGHTDHVGDEEANRQLSEKRAEAVANYLDSKGIDKQGLKAVGYGETKPVAPNETAEGRLKNRRVECRIK